MSHADTPDPTPPKAPFFDINSILGSSKPIASGDGLQQIFKSAPPPSSKWKPSPIPGTFKGAKDGGIKGVGKLAGFKPFLQRGGGNGPGVGNIGTEGGNKPMGDDAKDKSVGEFG
ncbi:hypothetical protein HK104_008831 [Borealophlyctis nickersoniae]|nr:hypothetical protein HK104_008831 [Borealophlyctis nickersoniae]